MSSRPLHKYTDMWHIINTFCDRNCDVFSNSHWVIFPGFSLQLSNRNICLAGSQWFSNTLYELPTGYPVTFGHYSVAFLYPFRSALRLSNSLSEHFPVAIGKHIQFLSIFPEAAYLDMFLILCFIN